MRDLQCVMKLLYITSDIQDDNTKEILFALLMTLIGSTPRHGDLLLFGQFIASKLPLVISNLIQLISNFLLS